MLDFDTEIIRKNNIELLDCQVDLILRSLEFYAHTYKFLYPRRGKAETKEEELRISLVKDTYEQIMNQFANSKIENPVFTNVSETKENFFKKVS